MWVKVQGRSYTGPRNPPWAPSPQKFGGSKYLSLFSHFSPY